MNTPPALLSFFRQEAGEYLDRLDHLLRGDEAVVPDGAEFLSQARALRGAATMTRLPGLPELAATLERVAAGLRGGELRWDQRLQFAVRGALVELRALIDKAEHWTDGEQRLARTHSVALAAVAAGYLTNATTSASPASAVIPIARLFPDDGVPGLVERNQDPPITLAARFRGDMAAAADGVAREAVNLIGGERGAQQLSLIDAVRRTLLGLGDVAESYGATSIANLSLRMARSALERPAERAAVQAFAQLLMDRELGEAELAARVREHATTWPGTDMPRGDTPLSQAALPTSRTPMSRPSMQRSATPMSPPAVPRFETPRSQPSAPQLTPAHAIARPTPAGGAEAERPEAPAIVVPIESLLYHGESALARARTVRDELRAAWQRAGGTAMDPTTSALLDELSDLLDLAVAR